MRNFSGKLLIIAAVLLMGGSAANGAVVRIVDEQNRSQVVSALAAYSGILDRTAQRDSVAAWAERNGYLDASLVERDDTIELTLGAQYLLRALIVHDSTEHRLEVNEPFTNYVLEKVSSAALAPYQRQGYYYARLAIDRLEKRDSSIIAYAGLQRGPMVTIGEVRLTGELRTSRKLLDRYLDEFVGQPLSADLINRIEQTVQRIPAVRISGPVQIQPRSGYTQADILIPAVEPNQWSVFGGLGYLPAPNRTLTWDIRGEARNLFGQAKSFAVRSERRGEARTNLTLRYGQPVFWIGTGDLSAELATRDYRDRFYEFGAELAYGAQVQRSTELRLALQYGRVEPANDSLGYSRYGAVVSAERTNFDDPWNPSRGLGLATSIAYANRQYRAVEGLASLNETRTAVSLEGYLPIVRPLLLRMKGQYAGYETKEDLPPTSELYLLGGPSSIRGYRTDQFEAQRYGIGTLEPRLRFASGYIALFYDYAWLRRPMVQLGGGVMQEETSHSGYGLGLGLSSGQLAVHIESGWSPDSPLDDPHVSIQLHSDF